MDGIIEALNDAPFSKRKVTNSITSPSWCDASSKQFTLSKFIDQVLLVRVQLYSLPLRQLIQLRPGHRKAQPILLVPLPHQFPESLARPGPPTRNDTPQQTVKHDGI